MGTTNGLGMGVELGMGMEKWVKKVEGMRKWGKEIEGMGKWEKKWRNG